MHIEIDPGMKEKYGDIRLACFTFEAEVTENDPDTWAYIEGTTVPAVMAELAEKTLAGIEGVHCSREAYKAFGRSPSRYRVSSESLIRRIRQGHELYHVNSVVDVNNLISLESALSVGTFDLDKLHGQVVFSLGQKGEGYEGIGKDFIDMENMPILRDDEGLFGSTTSDSRRAMVTEEGHRFLLVIYCFSRNIDLPALMERSEKYLREFAGAEKLVSWMEE